MNNVTIINIFTVPQAIKGKFVKSWHKTAEQMKQQPGFIDTTLHRNLSEDGQYKYVNVAHSNIQLLNLLNLTKTGVGVMSIKFMSIRPNLNY